MGYNTVKGIIAIQWVLTSFLLFSTHSRVINQLIALGVETRPFWIIIEMKTVTVLVSTYNGQKYLSKQLDSLISQVGVDMKIIVRDDGSSDGTRQILRNYAQTYSNIQLLFEDNCGAEESFNRI